MVEVVFTRAIEFGLEHYPELNKEQQWQRFNKHMEEKYSARGYIHLWINGSPNEKKLKEVREVIANKQRLRDTFDRIYSKCTDGNGLSD